MMHSRSARVTRVRRDIVLVEFSREAGQTYCTGGSRYAFGHLPRAGDSAFRCGDRGAEHSFYIAMYFWCLFDRVNITSSNTGLRRKCRSFTPFRNHDYAERGELNGRIVF